MRLCYQMIFSGTAVILMLSIIVSYSSKKNIARTLRGMMVSSLVAILANMVITASGSEHVCLAAFGVFFSSLDWVLYFMMSFSMKYTGSRNLMKYGPAFFRALIFVDSTSMLLNYFFRHAFSSTRFRAINGDYVFRLDFHAAGYVHLVLSYLLLLFAILCLVVKSIRSPKVYRIKYISILLIFLFVLGTDMAYVFFHIAFDLSIIGFALGSVLMYYMSIVYVPKSVVDRLLSMVVHDMVDAVILFDMDGKCIQVNESAIKLLEPQYQAEPEHACEVWYQKELMKEHGANGRDTVVYLGEKKLYLRIYLKHLYDEKGSQIGDFINIQNRTQEVNDLAAERYRATHDALTGVYNKEFFYERVRQVLDRNPDEEYMLILSDIGNFKLVNDVFGTDGGDKVLIRIAKSLRKMSRPGQIYGRIENDGFALLMKKADYNEKFFATVPQSRVYVDRDIEYPIRLYLGVYEVKQKEIAVSAMCDRAKMAIATIKGNYQKRLAYYDEELRQNVLNEQEIMGELDEAITSGQFKIYLQPQVDADGKSRGAEALVRWIHPVKGFMPPADFIDILEKNGAIIRLDQHVWELACQKLKEWTDKGREDMYLSVNISPKDFYFIDVYETFVKLVDKYGVDPKRLHLEITETSVMNDVQQRIEIIEKLQNYGFIVEMDDFGSGYSSLNMLKEIHVNVLKVDMVFLRKTTEMERSRKILRTIIALAQELGMETIVEGVETSEQLEFLKSISCNMFQGYYFAKPMETGQFEEIYMR